MTFCDIILLDRGDDKPCQVFFCLKTMTLFYLTRVGGSPCQAMVCQKNMTRFDMILLDFVISQLEPCLCLSRAFHVLLTYYDKA